jgi:manganese oxidase
LKAFHYLRFVLCVGLALTIAASVALAQAPQGGTLRTYYIAAEEVMWNYAPHGNNLVGVPGPELEGGAAQASYRKAVYHEYTDGTFKQLKQRSQDWEHLGILGPLIRAEVGDTIKVVFKNNTNIFCSMHPHGLAYSKESEGALYNDGSSAQAKKGDAVPPGQTFTYTWAVPERAGPAAGDSSSILWIYHSHFVEPRDMNTGLFGPIIVTRKGAARADGSPNDVDREFVVGFSVFDETESWFFEANSRNRRKYTPGLKFSDPVFRQQYLLYSINGLVEGNLPVMKMRKGEHVRWYLFANGNEDDVHTPHWHGQTVTFMGMRTDMVHLEPMMMVVADMIPDNMGTWLFHCHVNDHIEGGMQSLFIVTP